MDKAIKFRPIRPYSPHLNGKVERSQRTDRVEFYAAVERSDPEMESKLKEWQHFYNWTRPHGSHGGKPPMECYFKKQQSTPLNGEIVGRYNPSLEYYRARLCSRSTDTTPETRLVILTRPNAAPPMSAACQQERAPPSLGPLLPLHALWCGDPSDRPLQP